MIRKLLAPLVICASSAACAATPHSSDPVGRLYHYLRTNQDGSEPEHIWVYRKSATEVEVVKEVERCTRSAYVTAVLDPKRHEPISFIGGRLQPDGTQQKFAFLTYTPATRELSLRVPDAKVETKVVVEHAPWRVYDFDLADLTTLSASRAPERADFAFGLAMTWPADPAHPLKYLGQAKAKFSTAEEHMTRNALRYSVSGALNGDLWLDAREGHVIEARFAEPNHSEYKDFRLVLQTLEIDALKRWHDVRFDHWRDCKDE
jgi:hypothetical protein